MRLRMFILLLLMPLTALCQDSVAPVTRWLATVDSATQQIVLRWRPSADTATMGYQICTGDSSLSYDSVIGRFDTSYICTDHSPLVRHTYRLYVFDSTHRVSSMTPHFGNVVLEADVPDCENTISARWTPYEGIPGDTTTHPIHYCFWQRLEPFDTAFVCHYTANQGSPMEHTFSIPESVTRVWLRVEVVRNEDDFHSFSNIVNVERRTVDTASVVEISQVTFDSIHTCNIISMNVDTAFSYTLYRSVDGSPWSEIATLEPTAPTTTYVDYEINVFDSLHCYQLGVKDACDMNWHWSETRCAVIPDPAPPSIFIPNAVIAGDAENGTFLPTVSGLKGDLYELTIFNRLGLTVYHTEDPLAGWTPAADTPQGVYTYFLRCRYITHEIKTYAGTVILIK